MKYLSNYIKEGIFNMDPAIQSATKSADVAVSIKNILNPHLEKIAKYLDLKFIGGSKWVPESYGFSIGNKEFQDKYSEEHQKRVDICEEMEKELPKISKILGKPMYIYYGGKWEDYGQYQASFRFLISDNPVLLKKKVDYDRLGVMTRNDKDLFEITYYHYNQYKYKDKDELFMSSRGDAFNKTVMDVIKKYK